ISKSHDSLLPSTALPQCYGPLGDRVEVVFAREHHCFGSLYVDFHAELTRNFHLKLTHPLA
ncbi:hypothetical protein PV794_19600, partial [Comamonas aquatica]